MDQKLRCFALHSHHFFYFIPRRYGHAPEVNVICSTRSSFSIGLVWLLGRHIGNIEHTAGRTVLFWRLAGAVFLLVAIVLIISRSAA